MKISLKSIVAVGISLLCFFLIVVFRTTPGGSLWQGYRIVYADVNTESDVVLSYLKNAGIKDVICQSTQKFPIFLPESSPEISLMMSSLSDSNYISKRISYFFDKAHQYNLFYISEKDNALAEKAIQNLLANGISSGIDDNTSYPIILPFFVICFSIFLYFISKTKHLFALSAVFPVLLSICMPFYSLAAAVILLLYVLFLILPLWKRKGAFTSISKNIIIILFSLTSVLIAFLTSVKAAFLFSLCIIGIASLLYFAYLFEKSLDVKYTFKPVFIRAARSIPIFTKVSKKALSACSAGIALMLFFSLFYTGSVNIKSKKMIFPSAHSNGIADTLPVLSDYVLWYYETISSPYKRLDYDSKKSKQSNSFTFPRYKSTQNGITLNNTSFSYDNSFSEKVINEIDSLPYPALEKMIKAQGDGIKAGYSINTAQKNTMFHTILIVIALIVPVFVLLRSKKI